MNPYIGELVVRFLRLLESGDHDGMRDMCTRSATVWHNDGAGEQTIGEKLERFRSLVATVEDLRFDIVRQFRKTGEVLQQNVLRVRTADGRRTSVHAAMYLRFEGDLIDRIEEYAYPVPAAA